MSSFGSSAINKSGKKPVPKAARRKPGTAIETQTQSQPATPALSAISVASSEDLPPVDESQHLAEESLITHAANETSQAARDGAEVRLQHRSQDLARQRGGIISDGEETLRGATVVDQAGESGQDAGFRGATPTKSHTTASAGALGDRRVEMGTHPANGSVDAADVQMPNRAPSRQRILDSSSRTLEGVTSAEAILGDAKVSKARDISGGLSDGSSLPRLSTLEGTDDGSDAQDGATAKRKRASGISDSANKRPKHLQTSGEITLESLQAEVQPSIEDGLEKSEPLKKPRKVRKDKGVPRKRTTQQSQANEHNASEEAPPAPASNASTRQLRKRPTATPQVAAGSLATEPNIDEGSVESETHQRKRKKRKATPDGNEDVQIDPAEVQMADMLVDKRTGKVSTLEKRMREIDWAEVNRKRKAARMSLEEGEEGQLRDKSRLEDEEGEQPGAGTHQDEDDTAATAVGPARQRTRMVNGVITVVDEALHVDRHAEGDAEMENLEVVEHEDLTERITSNSWIDNNRRDPVERKYGRRKADPWNLRDTDKFYEALRMFGTDFFVIAKMFKGKTRRQVKMKFVREEHDDPDRIKRALHGERKLLDIEAFKAVTGISHFKSPEEILSGLEEDRREREEQIVRAREEYEEEQRQKKFLEASGGPGTGETGESAKENEAPGTKGRKKAKAKSKIGRGPVASADQAAEVVETIED